MANVQLTERQQEVYELVRSLIRERGYGPTVREIGEHFGIRSPNGVMCHLRALERKGLITRKANKSRAIELTGEDARSPTGLPMAGIVRSQPTDINLQTTEVVDLGKILANGDRFVVQMSGDSLVSQGIHDGDYIVINKQDSVQAGQLAAVETMPGAVSLRYWHPTNGHVELRNGDPNSASMTVPNPKVVGVAVASVRTVL
ncbi:transcriptional repressor LexA [Rhodopirellula sp. JC740]|uniref:Transcriptional repressor LexA n=1 Tax=Rhodopirellula halodulae TaxID=2894198 RepID=A0ABS8NMS7_9BACT|nr:MULTISPECIES: transcriptional repressor LexA [unclassified Rhodopirellula]MCC9644888.1 transcriptional repressor LexA [Rhodopirellula sp. JC740]MCC9657503.1 transcriptional repressor LexA [Rhodopirellula sp. JC737]